jgi:hypothetical protein
MNHVLDVSHDDLDQCSCECHQYSWLGWNRTFPKTIIPCEAMTTACVATGRASPHVTSAGRYERLQESGGLTRYL